MSRPLDDRFYDLVSRHLDGGLLPEEQAELAGRLNDPAGMAAFLDLTRLDTGLAHLDAVPVADDDFAAAVLTRLVRVEPAPQPAVPTVATPAVRRSRPRLIAAAGVAVAASVAFAAGGWALHGWYDGVPVVASQPVPVAVLREVYGEVYVAGSSGGRTRGRVNQPLYPGQGVETVGPGSLATVGYPDGTRIELGSDTAVGQLADAPDRADTPPRKTVYLSHGTVAVDAAEQPPGRPMTLTTPQAEVFVVGTRFVVETESSETDVRVTKGSVRVRRAVDNREIEVAQGNAARATPAVDRFEPRAVAATAAEPLTLHTGRGVALAHNGGVAGLAFSPDGKTLASATLSSGTVRFWDLTGRIPATPVERPGHTAAIWSVAYSPDGTKLASGGVDQTVRLTDLPGREPAVELPHKDHVRAVAFSPDGRWLATGAHDSVVRLRDPLTGAERRACPQNEKGGWSGVYDLAFSPDSRWLAVGLSDRRARVFDPDTGRTILIVSGHSDAVRSITFSPDGKLLATASPQEVRVWEVPTGKLRHTLTGAYPVTFSPDGKTLAVGGAVPALYDPETGATRVRILGHVGTVYSAVFSPDGRRLALGGWRGVTLLDLPPGRPD